MRSSSTAKCAARSSIVKTPCLASLSDLRTAHIISDAMLGVSVCRRPYLASARRHARRLCLPATLSASSRRHARRLCLPATLSASSRRHARRLHRPLFRAFHSVARVTKSTTLIELRGIKIALTTGLRCPLNAKPSPTKL